MSASSSGLRERKKRRTRQALSETAMALFRARGFDAVTVTEIARAADVSEQTVYNYFPTKEDLFFDRAEEVESRLADVVRRRPAGQSVIDACREDFLEAIAEGHYSSGLGATIVVFYRMIDASPALQARVRLMTERSAGSLAAALADAAAADTTVDDLEVVLLARTLVGVRTTLQSQARRLMLDGVALPEAGERLTAATRAAYTAIARGLAELPAAGPANVVDRISRAGARRS